MTSSQGLFQVASVVALFFAADGFAPTAPSIQSTTTTRPTSFLYSWSSPNIVSTLKKPSKVLTVGVEYDAESSSLTPDEVGVLSMQLRKSKVNAILCNNVEALTTLFQEQASALGNFPGPCPVIFCGDIEAASAAVDAKIQGIVVEASSASDFVEEYSAENKLGGAEPIWKVSSVDAVTNILEMTEDQANAFWIDNDDNFEEICQAIPKSAMVVYAIDAMQPDATEIDNAKSRKLTVTKPGASSIFVREACVGDGEDTQYAQFLVDKLTTKASSEFSFSGLTGSTNGHFGGVQASGTVKWERTKRREEAMATI